MSHFSVSVIVPHDYSNSHVTANDTRIACIAFWPLM